MDAKMVMMATTIPIPTLSIAMVMWFICVLPRFATLPGSDPLPDCQLLS